MQLQFIELFIIFIAAVIGVYTVVFTIKNNTIRTQLEVLQSKLEFEEKAIIDKEQKLNELEEKLKDSQNEIALIKEQTVHERLELEDEIRNQARLKENLLMEEKLNEKRFIMKLEQVSGLSKEEAKSQILQRVEQESKLEISKQLKFYDQQLKLDKKALASEILIATMESISVDTTNEMVIRSIDIPNEDLKGKLIGREGRNIRLLEHLLGANIIIDDTPNSIFISCFNAKRRAIAHITLENLVKSGKINQITIEETVKKATIQIEDMALETGKETVYKFNINDMPIELISEIGIMQFRSSYGQNLLQHSIEAASIASKIATELSLDPVLAARCLLLHDIGKNESAELGISHVSIGVKKARKYGESEVVLNAIEAHHEDVETNNLYAELTIIADSMSASRIGARRDQFEAFIKRVESLENIAKKQKGVHRAYALQGGREVRVIVESKSTSDSELPIIAKKIRDQIEDELAFPGVIKVRVIRETQALEHAAKENIEVI